MKKLGRIFEFYAGIGVEEWNGTNMCGVTRVMSR